GIPAQILPGHHFAEELRRYRLEFLFGHLPGTEDFCIGDQRAAAILPEASARRHLFLRNTGRPARDQKELLAAGVPVIEPELMLPGALTIPGVKFRVEFIAVIGLTGQVADIPTDRVQEAGLFICGKPVSRRITAGLRTTGNRKRGDSQQDYRNGSTYMHDRIGKCRKTCCGAVLATDFFKRVGDAVTLYYHNLYQSAAIPSRNRSSRWLRTLRGRGLR